MLKLFHLVKDNYQRITMDLFFQTTTRANPGLGASVHTVTHQAIQNQKKLTVNGNIIIIQSDPIEPSENRGY